jgi:FKBP-type peptidyl-prolyl cis-trans isomerase FkpA
MNRLKYLLLMVCIAGCFAACRKDDEAPAFDYLTQFKTDTVAIRSFIKEKGLNSAFIKDSEYGIFYQIEEAGAGDDIINSGSIITVDYEGRFLSGAVFDSRNDEKFTLRSSIAAWQFAVPLIKKGGRIRVITPSFYAYRNIANERIPANSILDFTITLKKVE